MRRQRSTDDEAAHHEKQITARAGAPRRRRRPEPRHLEPSRLLLGALRGDWWLGLLVLGRGGLVLDANATAEAMCGRTPADLAGRTLASLAHPDDRGSCTVVVQRVLSGDAADAREEVLLLSPTGRAARVELRLTAVADERGTRYAIASLEPVADRRRHEAQLRQLADTDPLTGLFNRRRFRTELDRHLDRCRRYGAQGALMLLDVDGLKAINDHVGHAAGDLALTTVANVLRARLRSTDVIGRLGGDEFVVLLPHAGADAAARVAWDLCAQSESALASLDGHRPGLSAGVAVIGDGAATSEALLRAADDAMYEAKRAGGHRFAFSTSEGWLRSA